MPEPDDLGGAIVDREAVASAPHMVRLNDQRRGFERYRENPQHQHRQADHPHRERLGRHLQRDALEQEGTDRPGRPLR